MSTFLVILSVVLFFWIIKLLVDLNSISLRLSKSKELNNTKNPLDEEYEFIRGLH
jgi:hypothetical protein